MTALETVALYRVRQRACTKALQPGYSVVCDGEVWTPRGYEAGTFSDQRAHATKRDRALDC